MCRKKLKNMLSFVYFFKIFCKFYSKKKKVWYYNSALHFGRFSIQTKMIYIHVLVIRTCWHFCVWLIFCKKKTLNLCSVCQIYPLYGNDFLWTKHCIYTVLYMLYIYIIHIFIYRCYVIISNTSLLQFKYGTCFDYFLMFVGSFCAICHGAALPSMIIVFGDMTNTFVNSGIYYNWLLSISAYLATVSITIAQAVSDPAILK